MFICRRYRHIVAKPITMGYRRSAWSRTPFSFYVLNTNDVEKSIKQKLQITTGLYRVIHKSVKHFKNSQQIHYPTDHGSSYADRE